MTLHEIYRTVHFLVKKNISGRTFTPDEFNDLLNYVTWLAYNNEYAHYEKSQEVTDTMSRFVIHDRIDIDVGALLLNNLNNYSHMIGIIGDGEGVEIVTNHQLVERLSDPVIRPTKKDPVAVIRSGYVIFYPREIKNVQLTYFRKPNIAYYANILDENDNLVYDPSSSIELDFNEEDHTSIIALILEQVGLHLHRGDIAQYAKQVEAERKPK